MGHISNIITKKHFDIFKKEAEKWINKFGLLDWEVSFRHEMSEKNRATCAYDYTGKIASLVLSTKWENFEPTTKNIKKTAFHEICELLLGEIGCLAEDRGWDKLEMDRSRHAVIRRLENAIFKKE